MDRERLENVEVTIEFIDMQEIIQQLEVDYVAAKSTFFLRKYGLLKTMLKKAITSINQRYYSKDRPRGYFARALANRRQRKKEVLAISVDDIEADSCLKRERISTIRNLDVEYESSKRSLPPWRYRNLKTMAKNVIALKDLE
ncbi:uncharacterized protein LOC124264605 [Haliotis rubra]|uniref:uncharacterized protein LOC124264605 n=1 Tax=Haliotis rubra TaxID=36100 RepID=UPI001EE4F0E9|nr:uncharacterized protein LOC124264605 [Haliotis rubra]